MKKHLDDLRETIDAFAELYRAILDRFGEWVYWKTRPRWTAEDLARAERGKWRLKILLMDDETKDAIFERARVNKVTVNPYLYRGG